MWRLVLVGLLMAATAQADRLELPTAVERTGVIEGRYVVDPPRTGKAMLRLEWTDALGRVVERQTMPVTLGSGSWPVRLDAGRAVAMDNIVRTDLGGATAEAHFVARPAPGWDDIRLIMYQDHAGARLAALRALGVDGVKVLGHRVAFTEADVAERIAGPREADLRWYVENIATDFYAAYHRWTPEHPDDVNFLHLEAQRRHRADPADKSVFERQPSLNDPAWLARIGDRLAATVRAHRDFRPFYYSLADEPGIADLAAAWDFDRSPPALAAFRIWLARRHGDLARLNAVWGSSFPTWDDVVPEGTTAAMARADGNYAAWNDHKAFMDESFAAALRIGRDAVRAADPAALAGIEGGQIPGWGGWDYGLLAPVVDLMEIYPAGHNVEIVRSLNPDVVLLGGLGGGDAKSIRQAWRSVLAGVRGMVTWDEAGGMVAADGQAGPWAAEVSKFARMLGGGLGALLVASPPAPAEVAVLYSPASFRLSWLQEHRAGGDAWTERNSEIENADTAVRVAMRAAAADFAALGLVPGWVTAEQVARGELAARGIRLLLLPRTGVLGAPEIAGLAAFTRGGGIILTDGPAGTHDGWMRPRPAALEIGTLLPVAGRRAAIAATVRAATGRATPFTVGSPPTLALRRNGEVTLLGAIASHDDMARADAPAEYMLPQMAWVRDLRSDAGWRQADRLLLRLDGAGPALFAIAPAPLPAPRLFVPGGVRRAGKTVRLALGLAGPTPAATTVLHVELRDPRGQEARAYSGNVLLRGAEGSWDVPFALNDPPGRWTITVHDPLGGGRLEHGIEVSAP